jgi:hypothetical protein
VRLAELPNAALCCCNQYTAEIAAAKLPSEIAETQAKTGYFKALGATAGQPKPKADNRKRRFRGKENVNDTSNVHPWRRH